MPSTAAPPKQLRCSHCGREVSGTVHTRTSYHVDYYALHTGDVEPVTIKRADESEPLMTVLKLVRPTHVFTCCDCYFQPTIRAQRDQLFRPEMLAESDKSTAD
jgi:hypothetical protein